MFLLCLSLLCTSLIRELCFSDIAVQDADVINHTNECLCNHVAFSFRYSAQLLCIVHPFEYMLNKMLLYSFKASSQVQVQIVITLSHHTLKEKNLYVKRSVVVTKAIGPHGKVQSFRHQLHAYCSVRNIESVFKSCFLPPPHPQYFLRVLSLLCVL